MTLCKSGPEGVHKGGAFIGDRSDWNDACPYCGKRPDTSGGLSRGPMAVELGFARPEEERPTGVSGCSSFTWAMDPSTMHYHLNRLPDEAEVIEDEYGRTMTAEAFLRMQNANCPLRFYAQIGQQFS